ncbi:hypothetical protein [Staphylospora marina]|uniref:hypothetical protein n=1 Tax=Staphylospora marina TaxID=2490858 RepID=UPI000F5C282D|nr:hypothetical protein [Staphylospora marina]
MLRKRPMKSAFADRGVLKFPIRNSQGIVYGWLTLDSFVRWMELKSERPTTPANVVSLGKKSV